MRKFIIISMVFVIMVCSTLFLTGCDSEDFNTVYTHECSICGEQFKIQGGKYNSTLANSLKPYFEHIEKHIIQANKSGVQ